MNLKKKKKVQDVIQRILKWLFPWVSIFSFLQFLQFLISKCYFVQFEMFVTVLSLLGTWFWKKGIEEKILEKYIYRYVSKDSKLILNIYYGNIFDGFFNEFIKVIPMDSNLDCDRADIRIKSVQFQFRNKNFIDNQTLNDLKKSEERIIAYDNYFLLRIAEYTNTNNIELSTYTDYFSMIYELCQFIDDNAHGKQVVCSVIGGNIQFKEGNLNSMQRLQLLKLAIESYNFQHEVNIHIVVLKDEERNDKYNLTVL